jgi:transposase
LLEDASNGLTGSFCLLIERLMVHLKELDQQVREIELQIQAWHRENEASSKLARVPGIGPITASALIASIGDAKSFQNGRQFAAWLGLVPRQNSSGGKNILLGISKRGDTYLRTLLIHGARSVMHASRRKGITDGWLQGILQRRCPNVTAVALANRTARIVWALLAHNREFERNYVRVTAASK